MKKSFSIKPILGNFVFINGENKSKEIQGNNVLSFTKFVLGVFVWGVFGLGVFVWGVYVQGVFVRVFFVLIPLNSVYITGSATFNRTVFFIDQAIVLIRFGNLYKVLIVNESMCDPILVRFPFLSIGKLSFSIVPVCKSLQKVFSELQNSKQHQRLVRKNQKCFLALIVIMLPHLKVIWITT